MGQHRVIGVVGVTCWFLAVADARAGAGPGSADLLDQMRVPAVPAVDARAGGLPLTADPTAVPTPTAAGSALLLMAGILGCRVGRRAFRLV